MSCEEWQPLLVRAADDRPGALEPRDEARLAAHLDRCAHCRALLAEQQVVRRALAARPAAPAPPDLAARVLAELDGAPHWTELLAWRTWTCRLAPVAAGLLAVALIMGRGAAGSSTPATSPASGVAELAAAWVAGEPDAGDLPAFALLGQDGVDGDRLLEALLSDGPDEPLEP